MVVHTKDIKEVIKLFKEVKQVFADLNGDGIVALNKMRRLGRSIDILINRIESK